MQYSTESSTCCVTLGVLAQLSAITLPLWVLLLTCATEHQTDACIECIHIVGVSHGDMG